MRSSSRLKSVFRRKRSPEEPVSDPEPDQRLLSLSRELREDVVDALVAEGERVWGSLSRQLAGHVAEIQQEARGDAVVIERKIHDEVLAEVSADAKDRIDSQIDEALEPIRAYRGELDANLTEAREKAEQRLDELERGLETVATNIALTEHDLRKELESLVTEGVRKEFDVATERVARLLRIERRQTDAYLEREITQLREEIRGSKVVVTRAEAPSVLHGGQTRDDD